MNTKEYYVYILSNKMNTTLYVGVTNNLIRRVYEHKNKMIEGFTKKYNVNKLVYFESTTDAKVAMTREKQLKGGSRKQKIELIKKINSNWNDLYFDITS